MLPSLRRRLRTRRTLPAAGLRRRAYRPPISRLPGLRSGAPPPAGLAGPPVYARPRGIIVAPEGPAYEVSEPAYQPGDEYVQGPALVDGRRYYRECWLEWGYRRCALKPRWW